MSTTNTDRGVKRARPDNREADSQELPEKKKLEGDLTSNPGSISFRPSAIPAPKSTGLFRQSKLAAPDVSKTLQQLQDKQDQEKKERGDLVLRDPAKEYHPAVDNGAKQLTVPTTKPPGSNGSMPTFGSGMSFGLSSNGLSSNGGTTMNKTESNGSTGMSAKTSKNPFAKVAAGGLGSSNGFGGFGSVKTEGSASNTNTFGRIAKTEPSWVKPEPVKTEPTEPEEGEAVDVKEAKEILTGEEEEKNVLQINAKLYQFDKQTQTYSERGRGILRMNDRGEGIEFGSRCVFRTTGTQRVALNTKLWPGMSVEQVSQKSVRISAQDATDATGVGVFLLQTNVADSKELFKAIDSRILQMKQNQKARKSSDTETSKESAPSS